MQQTMKTGKLEAEYWGDPSGNIRRMSREQEIIAPYFSADTALSQRNVVNDKKLASAMLAVHNTLDNRRRNLRGCTSSQNAMNTRKQRGRLSSRYKGVRWHKDDEVWSAQIHARGKYRHLGHFYSEVAAAIYTFTVRCLTFFLGMTMGRAATPSAESQTASTKRASEPPREPGEIPDKDRARTPPLLGLIRHTVA